jgi:hypothetical protein
MKFSVTFKTPGALDGLTEDLEPFLKQWIRYSEYVTIDFDTEKGTAEVKRVK